MSPERNPAPIEEIQRVIVEEADEEPKSFWQQKADKVGEGGNVTYDEMNRIIYESLDAMGEVSSESSYQEAMEDWQEMLEEGLAVARKYREEAHTDQEIEAGKKLDYDAKAVEDNIKDIKRRIGQEVDDYVKDGLFEQALGNFRGQDFSLVNDQDFTAAATGIVEQTGLPGDYTRSRLEELRRQELKKFEETQTLEQSMDAFIQGLRVDNITERRMRYHVQENRTIAGLVQRDESGRIQEAELPVTLGEVFYVLEKAKKDYLDNVDNSQAVMAFNNIIRHRFTGEMLRRDTEIGERGATRSVADYQKHYGVEALPERTEDGDFIGLPHEMPQDFNAFLEDMERLGTHPDHVMRACLDYFKTEKPPRGDTETWRGRAQVDYIKIASHLNDLIDYLDDLTNEEVLDWKVKDASRGRAEISDVEGTELGPERIEHLTEAGLADLFEIHLIMNSGAWKKGGFPEWTVDNSNGALRMTLRDKIKWDMEDSDDPELVISDVIGQVLERDHQSFGISLKDKLDYFDSMMLGRAKEPWKKYRARYESSQEGRSTN
ncbi:hypothetical protein KJ903_03505 [Patescibacteria group bacterium]|nr:hypothetical protein [Patescibacteria group bacterium]